MIYIYIQLQWLGILLAEFKEHKLAINALAISPDHSFFVSVSDDETIRIWDTARIGKNPANCSRMVKSDQGGMIKVVTFCSNSHSIATSSTNGTICLTRINISNKDGEVKYNGFETFRTIQLDKNTYAMNLIHNETELESVLIYCTVKGYVCGHELRNSVDLWSFTIPQDYGSITVSTYNDKLKLLLIGTNRGVVYLWDTTLKKQFKVWQHQSERKICQIGFYGLGDNSASSRLVFVSIESQTGEISVWDMDKVECTNAWCILEQGTFEQSTVPSQVNFGHQIKQMYASGISV